MTVIDVLIWAAIILAAGVVGLFFARSAFPRYRGPHEP